MQGGGGRRNVNQQWTHDLFDEDRHSGRSVASRLGPRGGGNRPGQGGSELLVENLHYNVVEKDLQVKRWIGREGDIYNITLTYPSLYIGFVWYGWTSRKSSYHV